MWPVVTALERVDLRCTTKLSRHKHDGRFEEITIGEIVDECRQSAIENRRLRRMACEVCRMGIEALQRDINAPHSSFDEPPRDKAATTKRSLPVG